MYKIKVPSWEVIDGNCIYAVQVTHKSEHFTLKDTYKSINQFYSTLKKSTVLSDVGQ